MISDIVAAMNDIFTADGFTLSEPIALGKELAWKHGAPDRIVLVQTADSFAPPKTAGGQTSQILTRVCGVDASIWGASVANVDSMINEVVRSLWMMSAGHFSIGNGRSINDTAILSRGFAYVLPFTVDIPVTDSVYPLGPDPEEMLINRTGNMIFPSGQEISSCG